MESIIGFFDGTKVGAVRSVGKTEGDIKSEQLSRQALGYSGDALLAAICGHPTWKNSTLARIAESESSEAALLAAYRKHPDSFLDEIGGQFAICIVDKARSRATLAIDRFGIGQMFWSHTPDGSLWFGTKLSQLRNALPIQTNVRRQSLYEYFYFHHVPSPNTIWENVRKLEPGTTLIFDNKSTHSEAYWQPSFSRDRISNVELQNDLFDTLRNSVGAAECADTTGAFLSGGLDSSTICGILNERPGNSAQAFTVSFDQEGYDELEFARIAARHFDLLHHVVVARATDTASSLNEIFAAFDEPFGNSSVVPAFLCAKAAKSAGMRTLLAGDGGDELFAGNYRYAKQQLFEKYWLLPHQLRKTVFEPLFCGLLRNIQTTPIRKVRRYIEQAKIRLPARLESYNHLEIWPSREIFTAGFLADIDESGPMAMMTDRFNGPDNADTLDRMLYLDWKFTLADNDLRKVTTTCDLAGVDVRFPFLDDDVVEMSTRVPSRQKLRGHGLRHFYKAAMNGYLPVEILRKPKQGFGLPFGEWLKTSKELQEQIYQHLNNLKHREIVNEHFVDKIISQHRDGHAAFYGEAVWIFAALELWFANHEALE